MKPRAVIVGAGGHGRVVASAMIAQAQFEVAGFIDDAAPVGTRVLGEVSVVATRDDLTADYDLAEYFIIAIGNNEIRAYAYDQLKRLLLAATVVHPRAFVDPSADIGSGSVVLAGAIVSCGVRIGTNCIINAGVTIDHDTVIGDHVHLSVGSVVRSRTNIADGFVSEVGARL